MITLLLVALSLAVVFGVGLGILTMHVRHAPEGYEDAAGFHFGAEPDLWQKHFLISTVRESREDRGNGAFAPAQIECQGPRVARPSLGVW